MTDEVIGCVQHDCAECRKRAEASQFRWVHVNSHDELEAFYRRILPAVRTAARECGYALAAHGSMRRDLDLIAAPWSDGCTDRDTLAAALHEAACGTKSTAYVWEAKPCGRYAASFPVCWTGDKLPALPNMGHIDLSVVAGCVHAQNHQSERE